MNFDFFALLARGIAMFKQFPALSVLFAVLLLGAIGILIYMFIHAHASIPIAVSRLESKWFSNYAGFFDNNNRDDSQVWSLGTVTITNTSTDQKVALDLFLEIKAKDEANKTNFRVPADLQSSWGIYGRDDIASKKGKRSPNQYFANPIEIGPRELARKELVFLFNFGDIPLRDHIVQILMKSNDYTLDLIINDLISGNSVSIRIPGDYRG